MLRACACGLLLLSLGGWLPAGWWCELFVHFLPQYSLVALLVGLAGWRDGWVRWPAGLVLLLNLWILWPFYLGSQTGCARGRLVLCNVLNARITCRC